MIARVAKDEIETAMLCISKHKHRSTELLVNKMQRGKISSGYVTVFYDSALGRIFFGSSNCLSKRLETRKILLDARKSYPLIRIIYYSSSLKSEGSSVSSSASGLELDVSSFFSDSISTSSE